MYGICKLKEGFKMLLYMGLSLTFAHLSVILYVLYVLFFPEPKSKILALIGLVLTVFIAIYLGLCVAQYLADKLDEYCEEED